MAEINDIGREPAAFPIYQPVLKINVTDIKNSLKTRENLSIIVHVQYVD